MKPDSSTRRSCCRRSRPSRRKRHARAHGHVGAGREFQITGLASSQSFITQKRASALVHARLRRRDSFFKTNRPASMKIIARAMRTDDMEAVARPMIICREDRAEKPYPSVKESKRSSIWRPKIAPRRPRLRRSALLTQLC
jgi:hypothetical protein